MTDVFKLSEAAKLCGVSVPTLRMLIADGLLPATRTSNGHSLLSADAVPTWQQCRNLIEGERDRALQRAAKEVSRIAVEIEAVGNDIAEARENPRLQLGVDLLATTKPLSAALSRLDFERTQVILYDRALKELIDRDRS